MAADSNTVIYGRGTAAQKKSGSFGALAAGDWCTCAFGAEGVLNVLFLSVDCGVSFWCNG